MKKPIIPPVGLGTWRLNDEECEKIIPLALELGYRHIDTADIYGNHRGVAKGIKNFNRKEILLATKLFMEDLTPEKVESTTHRFLEELEVDYIDLLLIHWPYPKVDLEKTLEAMEKLKHKGIIKYLGISNFVRSHIHALAHKFPILTNQIEVHPYFQRRELVKACQEAGIIITSYRPVAEGAFEKDPTMIKIGKHHGKSPSQIALRWLYQKGIPSIPKAAKISHLKDNINIFDFELSSEEMSLIDSLDADRRYCAPSGFPIFED